MSADQEQGAAGDGAGGAGGDSVALDFGPWEQIFYGEFDGMRRKRARIKIIGDSALGDLEPEFLAVGFHGFPCYYGRMDSSTPLKEVETLPRSDNLIGMQMTLTDFQRDFRKAREAADRGQTVRIADSNGLEYLFERYLPEYPFKGLEHLFGSVDLPHDGLTASERVRKHMDEKVRRR